MASSLIPAFCGWLLVALAICAAAAATIRRLIRTLTVSEVKERGSHARFCQRWQMLCPL